MRNFKDLGIWQRSMELVDKVYDITSLMPKDEKYGLISQIRRSAVSIPSNIAEGTGRRSNKEFARFLEIAQGSAFELETQLIIIQRRKMINSEKLDTMMVELVQIQKMLFSYYSKVRGSI